MKKIGIASDHAGYEMKEFLVGYLNAMGYEVLDFGAHSPESVDYADFAHPLAEAIENGELERGVALCGSGEGMTMTLRNGVVGSSGTKMPTTPSTNAAQPSMARKIFTVQK